MNVENSEQFTQVTSNWLNIFINDLATNPDKVLAKVDDFPGEHKFIKQALKDGPNSLDKRDVKAAKDLFNFIEFYATGKFSNIEVEEITNGIDR